MQANTHKKSDVQSRNRGDIYAIAFFSIPCFFFSLIVWQGANSVAELRTTFLKTARSKVSSVHSDPISDAHEGQLVYVRGVMKPQPDILTDPYFNVSTEAFALVRQVMKGNRNNVESLPYNPNLTGTYFLNPCPTMVWKSAKQIKVGAYELTWDQVFPLLELRTKKDDLEFDRLDSIRKAAVPLPLSTETRDRLSSQWGERLVVDTKEWSLHIGDQYKTRVIFRKFEIPPTEISILAKQQGDRLVPYSLNNDSIFEIQVGNHDIESIFSIIQQKQLAKTYFARGFSVLLFAIGTVMVAQAFVPRKTWVAKEVAETKSGTESKSEYKQGIAIETEPFLLYHISSKTFLAGESRDIRDRFKLNDSSSVAQILFLGLTLLFLFAMMLSKSIEFIFPAITKPDTLRGIVVSLAALVGILYWIIRKLANNSSTDRMIRQGELLQGSIVSCTGKITGNGETNWYSVKVVYRFSNPEKIDLIGECERDRDDLDGQPLPTEGTVVLVLYLDDNTYALL